LRYAIERLEEVLVPNICDRGAASAGLWLSGNDYARPDREIAPRDAAVETGILQTIKRDSVGELRKTCQAQGGSRAVLRVLIESGREEQINIPRSCDSFCLVKRPRRKRLTQSFVRHLHRPDFRQEALAASRVALKENSALPEPNFGLWKVAKIFHSLGTFQVHPWTVVTIHELVPQMIEWLGKLVHEPLGGS
jgi:hypothetical protein